MLILNKSWLQINDNMMPTVMRSEEIAEGRVTNSRIDLGTSFRCPFLALLLGSLTLAWNLGLDLCRGLGEIGWLVVLV